MQDFLKLPGGNSSLSIPLDTSITQNVTENTPKASLSISYKTAEFGRIRKPSVSGGPIKIEDSESSNLKPVTPQNRFLRKVLKKVESMRSSESSRAGSANSSGGRRRASSRASSAVQETKKKKKPKRKIPKGLNSKNYDRLLTALDLVVTKQKDKKGLKKIVRRNSCTCTWCGKTSRKEKKWRNLVVDKEQAPQPELPLPSARRNKLKKTTRRPSLFSHKSHNNSPSPGSHNEVSHDSVDKTPNNRLFAQRLGDRLEGGHIGKSPFSSFSRLTPTSPNRSEKVETGGFSDAITGPKTEEKKSIRRRNRSLFQTLQVKSNVQTPFVRSRDQSPTILTHSIKTETQFDTSPPASKFYFNFNAQTQPNLEKRHTLGGLQFNNFSKSSFCEADGKSLHKSITISQVPVMGEITVASLVKLKEYESVKPYLPAGPFKKAKSLSTQASPLKGIGSQLPSLKKGQKNRQFIAKSISLIKEKQDQDFIPLSTQKSDGVKSTALSRRTMLSLSPPATMSRIEIQPNSPNSKVNFASRKRFFKKLVTTPAASSIGSRGDLMQEVIKSVATSPQDKVGSIKRIYNNHLSKVSQRKKDQP